MKSYNLQHYIDKIKSGEKFSLARYGDGELLCMWGKEGRNSNGCLYSIDLRAGLLASMNYENDHSFIYGLQRVLPKDAERIQKDYPKIDWHDTEIFGEASANNSLDAFIGELKNHPITIIGNYSIRDATLKLLPHRWFIEVPPVDALRSMPEVIEKIKWENRFATDPKIYLFSCGMAANVMVSKLHGNVNGWLIDVGHIWDIFAGSKSRCDLL